VAIFLLGGWVSTVIAQRAAPAADAYSNAQQTSVTPPNPYAIRLANGPGWRNPTGKPLPVIRLEFTRDGAFPSLVQHASGWVILLLVNNSADDTLELHLDPAAIPDKVLGPSPIFHLGAYWSTAFNHRQAIAINLPAGEFHIKSAATATTLVTLKGS